jgi:hypothetical protein
MAARCTTTSRRGGGLVIVWEKTELWQCRQGKLTPEQLKASFTMVSTPQGMTRALLVPKALVRAEREAVSVEDGAAVAYRSG